MVLRTRHKTDTIFVRDKLIDIETDNLKQNLLFFAMEEKYDNVETNDENKGGATGTVDKKSDAVQVSENCTDTVLNFCEQFLNIENARHKIKIEKAYRLGKPNTNASKPRPIVAKFCDMSDREYVRSVSNRLKDTHFEKFDMIKQEQSCVNDIFSSFCKTVEGEMNDKLTCKTVCIGGSSLTNKKHRIKKPWWNDDLNKLWVDMCKAEKTWNKFNNSSRASELKSVYVQKRKYFDREVQKCKRKYWFSMQQDLLLESKRNQQQFWKKIGKIGVAENRKSVIPMEVIDQDGNVNSNLTAVLDKWKSEYSNLLNQKISTKVSETQNHAYTKNTFNDFLLTEPISFAETASVIDKAKKGKSAGFDNLPIKRIEIVPQLLK
ncbi:unnamed protein product [Mytilus edulis]|uniref:Uncharacterized protein n=1 Tax=Mytilus edulis TaxID=6550 RepID=A0A8S3UZ36_MYTED|nr:unnamed protein product [Mytilus edulis]